MFKKNFLSYLVASVLLALMILITTLFLSKAPSVPEIVIADVPVEPGQALYQCADNHTVQAVFMTKGPMLVVVPGQPPVSNTLVALSLDGAASIDLPQALSADGSRYATADESLVFWGKGAGAMVLENGIEATYKNCIVVKDDDGDLPQVYLDELNHFTLRYPAGYVADAAHSYDNLGPNQSILGVKFTIPASLAADTNLSSDSYLSVEHLSIPSCSPEQFLLTGQVAQVDTVTDGNFTYLLASSSDAGAGNRYEEYVYALEGTNPCVAIRYFIHYSVFENYPTGTVTEFDKTALLEQFDAIKESLTIDAQFSAPLSLNAAVYPLYGNISWQTEEEGEFADMKGYTVSSQPILAVTDISALTQPFETYYADLLSSNGWEEDIALAAGGPGSAVTAYKKGGDYIVLQYLSDFEVNGDNEPSQCACSVEFSIFTGTK